MPSKKIEGSVFDEADQKRLEKYEWLDKSLWKVLLGVGIVDMANALFVGAMLSSEVNIFRTAEFFRSLLTLVIMCACSFASRQFPKQALLVAAILYFLLLAVISYFYPGVFYIGFKIRILTVILFALLLGVRVL